MSKSTGPIPYRHLLLVAPRAGAIAPAALEKITAGMDLVPVASTLEAFQWLELGHRPAIILLTPELSPSEFVAFVRKLQGRKAWQSLPVVMMPPVVEHPTRVTGEAELAVVMQVLGILERMGQKPRRPRPPRPLVH